MTGGPRRGAYVMVIPDGLCGAYVADEGGEWWCRQHLGHQGGHFPSLDSCDCPECEAADIQAAARCAAIVEAVRDRRRTELLNDGAWVTVGAMQVRLS